MILLSITTATMLALVVEQRRRMMGKASVALVVRKGFVYRFGRHFGPARSFLIFRPPAGIGLVRAPAGQAQDTTRDVSSLAQLEQTSHARIGLFAIDASTNRQIEYHSQERFPMCSTFKVLAVAAVLKRVDESTETLDRFVRYDEKQLLAYAPVTREHGKAAGIPLEALCAAAIEQSNNTSGNLLLEGIGGPRL